MSSEFLVVAAFAYGISAIAFGLIMLGYGVWLVLYETNVAESKPTSRTFFGMLLWTSKVQAAVFICVVAVYYLFRIVLSGVVRFVELLTPYFM